MTTLVNPAPKGWLNTDPGRGFNPSVHRGLDFGFYNKDPEGTKEVVAAAAGKVVAIYTGGGYNSGWGNFILIDHGNGFYTGYAHFRTGTIAVSLGQQVSAGQFLGWMGSTGNAKGDHLHFEVRLGGSAAEYRVDPKPYLDGKPIPGTGSPVVASTQRQVRANVGTEGYLNGRARPTLTSQVVQRLASNVVGTFDGFIRGQQVTVDGVTSNIWYHGAFNGNFFAAAGFTSQSTDGLADMGTDASADVRPLSEWFDVPAAGQYFYYQLGNALVGNYDARQLIPGFVMQNGNRVPNALRVIGDSGQGPRKVATTDKGEVWVGTRKNPAKTTWR